MFNFALGMATNVNLSAADDVAPALLWAIVLLAAVLGLNRSLALDRENQVFDALLIAPIPRTALYAGKVISITLFTLLLDAILVILFTVFFSAAAAGIPAIGVARGHGHSHLRRLGHAG
jgi:ABC-type transport system involved in cytochrome c biogenesis permease component